MRASYDAHDTGQRATPLALWFRQPASDWSEALPLGNGQIGAMLFGGIDDERIQINEQTLWGGTPHDYSDTDRTRTLGRLRESIFAGHLDEATKAGDQFLGNPATLMPYQPFVDINIRSASLGEVAGYRRALDLNAALHSVDFLAGATSYHREAFASFPDKVMVVRLTSDKPQSLSVEIALTSPQPGARSRINADGALLLEGQVEPRTNPAQSWIASWDKPGLKYAARLSVTTTGGIIKHTADMISVSGADEILLIFAGATSFKAYNDITGDPTEITRARLRAANAMSFKTLKDRHIRDYQRLFQRVALTLGTGDSKADQPTDERLRSYKALPDPVLEALYFQYGRYLLISSSRAGGQPANLQGLWNQDLLPAWGSKWTTNINLQMNYWIAEAGGLIETQTPLWDLVADLQVTGAMTAKRYYGARGWVLHHNTDLWRATAPVDGPWGIWPMGGVWLVNQMWDHYQFGLDERFLKERAYPAMRGAVAFILDILVLAPASTKLAGKIVTCPSVSPENQYQSGAGRYHLTYAATMDIMLVSELLQNFVNAARGLGLDEELQQGARRALERLPDIQIGARGQIQEWAEDYPEVEPTHRHTSHLYGLYPGHSISQQQTPQLASAAARTLELRGDTGTGWSMAWRANLYARLGNGEHAHRMIRSLLTDFTQPNLLDVCPPFQIDGNLGGAAGISEMLVQSTADTIHLLPALPKSWRDGEVTGLRARGRIRVDLKWRNAEIVYACLHTDIARKVDASAGGVTRSIQLHSGANRLGAPLLR